MRYENKSLLPQIKLNPYEKDEILNMGAPHRSSNVTARTKRALTKSNRAARLVGA